MNEASETIEAPGWTYSRRRWPGDPGAPGGRPNRVGFDYDAYVPGPIADWDPALPASLAADLDRAEAAIRSLTDNAPILAGLSWLLLRTEAIASSRIEGLNVSHHRLAVADADDQLAQFVLGNLRALEQALDTTTDLTTALLCELHRSLVSGTRDASIAGVIRDRQNWIGGRHPNPRGAAFIPPPENVLADLLDDLSLFCRRDDLPALLQAAITHVQFETIHPFIDGNGRVGRALIHLVLRRRGVIAASEVAPPISPPISLVLASHPDAYVDGLTSFREGRHAEWFGFFAESTYAAARLGSELARDIEGLQRHWHEAAAHPRESSSAKTLIGALPGYPILSLSEAVELTGHTPEAVRRGIARLADAGVLHETTGKKRNRRWESVGLFGLLDEFERSSRHPAQRPRAATSPPTGD